MNLTTIGSLQNPLIVSDGLVGYWPLNDGSGLVAGDFGGNNKLIGNISGNVAWATGRVGPALKFTSGTGLSSSVRIATSSYVSSLSTIAQSFTCWVNGTSFPNAYNTVVTTNGSGDVNRYFAILVKSTGKLAMYMRNTSDAIVFYDGTGTNTLVAGTWYHLAMTFTSTVGMIGYVNGVQDGGSATTGVNNKLGSLSLQIGGFSPEYNDRGFNGIIDDVRLYNRALTAAEVNQLYLARGT